MLPFWKFFIEKRQFTILLIASLVIWGVTAAIVITKESAPEVQIPVGIISVVLPGASAEDIERLVTNKLEERLANLTDLNRLTSVSRPGLSIITAEFAASADIDKSIQKLKDEVDKAKPDLPEEAKDPAVSEVNFLDQPVQIISISADYPYAKLAELADQLKRELQAVKGVSRVDVSGVRNREVQVVVKKEELARLGITLSQVVGAIGQSNASLPIGAVTVDDITYNISFKGSLDDISDIGGIAVLNISGRIIYLRDIADVSDGVEKATSYSRISTDGKPSAQAFSLFVYKVRGQDVTSTTAGVREKLEKLKLGVLRGSEVIISNDAGDQVRTDLRELTQTGLETMILVMLALFLTIGWREAIVAGLSIPLSFLIAFIGLLYSGNTINFLSLFSLILAIGILVDSGIVVVEAVHTRIRMYGDKKQAAFEALREYGWPLIGGTMATVTFFLPLFFISGIVGQFIASIPFTLIFVLIASIFVALGLVPFLTMTFSQTGEHSRLLEKQEEYAQRARTWYDLRLRQILGNRKVQNQFLIGMIVAFVLSIALPVVGIVKTNFFPGEDSEFVTIELEMTQGTALNQTDIAVRAIEEELYGDPRFASIVTTVGGTSAFSDSPQTDTRYANVTLNLVDKGERESSDEIIEDVKAKLADYSLGRVKVSAPTGGPPVGAAILIKYLGRDADSLDAAITIARRELEQTPGAIDIDSSNKNASTEFSLSIDRAKLAQLGLTPGSVASTLRTAVSGFAATSLTGGERDVDVVVSLNLNPNYVDPHDAANTTVDSLNQIPMTTPSGQTILLGSVLKHGVTRSDSAINHEGRERVVTLTSNVSPLKTPGEVLAAFNKRMEQVELPEGVHISVGGENEETNKSFLEMGYALLAGLALTFIILVLSFNSFRFAGYLLMIVPLSLIGVMGGLALTRLPLSFSSLLGVIALAGVIINHAIILMDAIIQRMKTGAGRPFVDIIVDAAVSRLRPIFLTTVTTVLGMIPLTYASSLWGPLAFSILFGLSFAMILTLVLIPVLVYRWPGKLPEDIVR